MKKGWIFAGLGVGILGFGLFKYFQIQAQLLKDYDYKIVGIKIRKFNVSEATIEFVVRFINKSNIEATITNLYLDIFIEGQNAGYVTNSNRLLLPANGSSDIPLIFSFSPKMVINNIVSFVVTGTKNKDLSFQIKGYADVRSGFVKKSIKIDFKDVLSTYIGSK